MSDPNCENFKSPKQLGLTICTSDVSCYDGLSLNCINLPSNPDLNDVIKAIDEKFCSLIGVINAFTAPVPAAVPNDGWVELTNADFLDINVIESDGFIVPGDLINDNIFSIAYKIISPDTALLKGFISLNVDLNPAHPTYEYAKFLMTLDFAAFTSPAGWFVGSKKMDEPFASGYLSVPVGMTIIPQQGRTRDNYAAEGVFRSSGANNRVLINAYPEISVYAGATTLNLRFEGSAKLVTT